MKEKWLQWATQLQSIAQAGLTFTENQYDIDRYKQIRSLAIEIMHEYTEVSYEKIQDLFAGETGYQTPKVDIRACVFSNNKIILVKEKADGAWSLPGGWADVNTSVSESVIRECIEEAGAIVRPVRIIAVLHANRHSSVLYPYTIYKIFVECELIECKFTDNTETLEAGFFSPDALPSLSVERNTKEQIEMCFEAKKHVTFKTIFD